MKKFGGIDLVKAMKKNDSMLSLLLAIYIVSGINLPNAVNAQISSTLGTVVLVVGSLALFTKVNNPVMSVLGLLAVYELMKRAKLSNGGSVVGRPSSMNSMRRKGASLSNFEYSLEGMHAGEVHNNDEDPTAALASTPVANEVSAFSNQSKGGGGFVPAPINHGGSLIN